VSVFGLCYEGAEEASFDPVTNVIEHDEPSKAIRDYIAENGIDLAVLGTHGQTDFSRDVTRGVSAQLVRKSPAPVMWVRASDADDPADS
jgi:nucleotide-binding universal stress UspA family protein